MRQIEFQTFSEEIVDRRTKLQMPLITMLSAKTGQYLYFRREDGGITVTALAPQKIEALFRIPVGNDKRPRLTERHMAMLGGRFGDSLRFTFISAGKAAVEVLKQGAENSAPPSLDSLAEEVENPQTFIEGATKSITINAYERDPKARQACIDYYGTQCSVCKFSFEEFYGGIGERYIHVHHLKPLSEKGGQYELNPIRDLRPVCPNCHAMLHKRKPPYSIEELKEMLNSAAAHASSEN